MTSKKETEREISQAIIRFEKEFMGRGPLEASFASEVGRFLTLPSVAERWTECSLAVCGLFYRSCDGQFLVYNPEAQSFSLLG